MDINPEIGIISGDYKNKFLNYLMLAMDKWTCCNAYKVIVHSNAMKKSLLDRNNSKKIKIKKINSFTVTEKNISREFKSSRFNYLFSKDSLNIIYAGNFGRFQGLEHVIKGFSLLKDQTDIRLILLGDGEEKEKLKKLSNSLKANVFFIDHVSQEESKTIIQKADLGLISLIPNIYKYAYPSKLMSYLEKGLPILGLIEKNSDLAKDIEENKIGFVIPLYDHINLRDLLINLQNNLYWKKNLKRHSLLTFKKKFSSNIMLKKWENII